MFFNFDFVENVLYLTFSIKDLVKNATREQRGRQIRQTIRNSFLVNLYSTKKAAIAL